MRKEPIFTRFCGRTPFRPSRRHQAPVFKLLVLLMIAFLPALGGCGRMPGPEAAADQYLSAWAEQDYETMYELLDDASQEQFDRDYFISRYMNISSGIGLRALETHLREKHETASNSVQFTFEAIMDTYTVGLVPIENRITLTRQDQQSPWLVSWEPALIFPELTGERRVDLSRRVPRRGVITDRSGRILAGFRTFKEIGGVPGRFSDPEQFARAVAVLLDTAPQPLVEKLNQPWVREGLYVPLAVLTPEQEQIVPELLQIPGVMINDVERRYYPEGEILAHVIGYIGEITAEELNQKKEMGYYTGDWVGKSGLEAALEPVLSGGIGFNLSIVEADGTLVSVLATREMRPAEDVVLTIDLELQRAAKEALDGRNGAIVALNPSDGQVLALASSPAFDPNSFIAGLTAAQWQELANDPAMPLHNRAIAGLYPPGSVFKPYTAAAAIEENRLDPEAPMQIQGKSWQPSTAWGGYQIERTYTAATSLNLNSAMMFSDNIYFARVGLTLGAELFARYGTPFGFSESIPFTLPVAVSRLCKEQIQSEVQLADSSFGQGEVLVTPLHMALIYAVFATGGDMPSPRLWLSGEPDPALWKAAVNTATAAVLHRSLVEAVEGNGALAGAGRIEGIPVAGKTGTAQIDDTEENVCWYVTYGPAAAPRLVVATVVEEGSWGGVDALPAGRAVLEKYLRN
ncbi:MAG: penicillin-binding transpeptidase domain-containing protein [Bacillota bacterium]